VIGSLRHILTDRAIEDLADIHGYLAERNPVAAEKVVGAITAKIVALALSGNTGVPRDSISPGLRAFPFKQRCIYFRVTDGCLEVVRVLHGRQDVSGSLFEET
jgi:plasmid stabilization system protein ParE